VAARKAAPITSVTMAGESPRLNNFKKLLSTAALSALLMLPVAAPAKEQLGGTFKILQGASSTQVTGDARRPYTKRTTQYCKKIYKSLQTCFESLKTQT